MTIQERLKEFIQYLNISEREFCRSIGVSPSYVQAVRNKINAATREAMEGAYPLLNTEWVLTGRGAMLLDAPRKVAADPEEKPADVASRLLALVESQQKTIAEQAATISRQAATIANLAEGYKKVSPEARAIPAPSVVD